MKYSLDDVLDRAFQFVYFVVEDRLDSITIIKRAVNTLTVSAAAGRKLQCSRGVDHKQFITRISLSGSRLLQYLVFLESETFEESQEQATDMSLREQDLVIRFVKFLVRLAWCRPSFHMNVGVSRILHRYTTEETQQLDYLLTSRFRRDYEGECRRVKGILMNALKMRFAGFVDTCRIEHNEIRFAPGDQEQYLALVKQCLALLTPWNTHCLLENAPRLRMGDLPRGLRGKRLLPSAQERVEWNRLHAIVDPKCYEQLTKAQGLDSPDSRLDLPQFLLSQSQESGRGPRDLHQRLPRLKDEELADIRRELDRQSGRRRVSSPKLLRIMIDGRYCTDIDVAQRTASEFTLDSGANLIAVYSHGEDEELLLATHMIDYQEDGSVRRHRSAILLEGGKEITFTVLSSLRDNPIAVKLDYRLRSALYVRSTRFVYPLQNLMQLLVAISACVWQRLFRFPSTPLVAYAGYMLALVLLIPAYWGIVGSQPTIREVVREVPIPRSTKPELPIISPHGLWIGAASALSRLRGVYVTPADHLTGNEPLFLLRFWIPEKAVGGFRYEWDITAAPDRSAGHREDTAKRYVVRQAALNGCDASGSCVIVCDRHSFPPGKYDLEVREIGPQGSVTAGPYRFSFEL